MEFDMTETLSVLAPKNSDIEALEPQVFFNMMKEHLTSNEKTGLERERMTVYDNIRRAEKIGQEYMLTKTLFAWRVIHGEIELLKHGFGTWCDLPLLEKFIQKVEPKGSVRLCNLQDYPRVIPEDCAEEIVRAKELKIFDRIVIVYTDFADEPVRTPAQEAVVQRNRDPIAFGVFFDAESKLRHDRLYFITDWEDEYCDLTFTKMIQKMATEGETGYGVLGETEDIDEAYIQNVIVKTTEALEKRVDATGARRVSVSVPMTVRKSPSWLNRLKFWSTK
jgi:hypothetical protein